MAKIDKFLSTMVGRGAPILRLDPGDVPVLEQPGGHRTTLNNQELLGTVLDGLAKEILPPEMETSYLRGEKVSFDHVFEGERFQVLVCRTTLGTRMVIGRSGPAGGGSAAASSATGTKSLGRIEAAVQYLLKEGASDLYLNTDEAPVLRRDGHLEPLADMAPLGAKDLLDLVKPWIPAKVQEAFQEGQDVEFSHLDPALPCRVRLSLYHDANGPSASLRVIPRQVPEADALGLSEPVRRLASLSKGLVLFTGPMGSGKTTTLASLLDLAIRGRKDFVVAIHDAIEFDLGGTGLIRQREVGKAARRQHQALRAALRQAPDVLVVDELRDPEAIDLVLQAAHAGLVVFATLRTTSLVDTLAFLVDGFPPERQPMVRSRLAGCLKAVVGHTLLRRPSGGRAAALETLFSTPAIADLIREDKLGQVPSAMRQGRYGQVTHNDALLQLIQRGTVEPMEAYLRCQDRESFIAACKKAGIDFDPRREGQVTTDV